MIRRLLSKLLGLDKYKRPQHRPYRSSDDYRRSTHGNPYNSHNQYGHSHYKRKRSSSSYSS